MKLDELIYEYLSGQKAITDCLAKYADSPAIFYQQAPEDVSPGWKQKIQYPHIEFVIDMQANPERKSSGRMAVAVLCEDTGILPEEIEPHIREALKDLFIKPDDTACMCLAWSKTETFQLNKAVANVETKVVGCEIWFDILEYPLQCSTDPDPVMACISFMRERYSECTVIGFDDKGRFFKPKHEHPAFYFRVTTLRRSNETNTVVWMDGKIAVHVFAPKQESRLQWITEFVNTISLDGEITMLDYSPMRIKGVEVNHGVDYLTQGQIIVSVQYGLLRYKAKQHRVTSTKPILK